MIDQETIDSINQLAVAARDREICGVVDDYLWVHPIKNVARAGEDFVFSRQEYGQVLSRLQESGRKILCVYHSHLHNSTSPTPSDLKGMLACKYDYLIVNGNTYTYVRCPHE